MKTRGYTLIELMAVISIASIMAIVGIPQFIQLQQKQELSGKTDKVLSSIRELGSNAIRQGKRCTFNVVTSGLSLGSSCQLSEALQLDNYSLTLYGYTSNQFDISFKGTFTGGNCQANTDCVIVVNSPYTANKKKCIAITILGIVRRGEFSNNQCQRELG
jgi:prepilin-type N-terminal cleavage/methylation domain-containing protein